jgi:hypothetical protein
MTRNRRYALLWFADHDADPTSVLLRHPPSTRMHRLMRREGELDEYWHLTEIGKRALEGAAQGRRQLIAIDCN